MDPVARKPGQHCVPAGRRTATASAGLRNVTASMTATSTRMAAGRDVPTRPDLALTRSR